MVHLCRNRPEGFGPHSHLHPNLPTTCFLDVVVEPLATWLFLLLLAILIPLRWRSHLRRHPRRHPALRPTKPVDEINSHGLAYSEHNRSPSRFSDHDDDDKKSRGPVARILTGLYWLLVVALLAMVSLEIARLVVAELGIGLLPFTYVGIVCAALNRITWKSRTARLANAAFWVMLTVVMALKTAAESDEEGGKYARLKNVGVVGRYPSSDEVIDNATMVGVEVVLVGLEFVGWKGLRWI